MELNLHAVAADLRHTAGLLDVIGATVIPPAADASLEAAIAAVQAVNGGSYVSISVEATKPAGKPATYVYRIWDNKAHIAPTLRAALALALAEYTTPAKAAELVAEAEAAASGPAVTLV